MYSETSLIKDTPKVDRPPNKGLKVLLYKHPIIIKSPPKEDNLSAKDRLACPKSVFYKRFHCSLNGDS